MATARKPSVERVIAKIRHLPPEDVAEVERIVDLLARPGRERRAVRQAARLSGAAFARVWDNPDDADYDRFSFADVVLVAFPVTDHTTGKQRPAAVISSADYNARRPDVESELCFDMYNARRGGIFDEAR